jgi:magnesium-transporting ATPase (P-type)
MSVFNNINNQPETPWHSLKLSEIFEKLNADENGLSHREVEKRRSEFGINELPIAKAPTLVVIFFRQLLNPLIYILIIAGLISLIIQEYSDAIFIFAVILLNSIIGAWQENKAEKTASSLKKLIKIKVTVVRNGIEKEIDSDELVPGDIVKLTSGTKIPADLRILESKNLSVDESLLTGESRAVEKNDAETVVETALINAQLNMLFAGTTIATGRATCMVVRTGIHTEVGKIAKVLTQSKSQKPPLILRMESFTKKISIIILVACFLLMIVSFSRGMNTLEVVFLVVALAVSAIPEGLPVALTVALSIAAFRMSKRNVVARQLSAVEGLGSCTLIASDKTGTLTVNQQTAKAVWLPSGAFYEIEGQGYNGHGIIKRVEQPDSKDDQADLREFIIAGALNNESELIKKSGKWRHHGDSIDVAFLALAIKNHLKIENLKKSHKQINLIPYESENRFSAVQVVHKDTEIYYVKGAVDAVVSMCSRALVNGSNKKINRDEITKQIKTLASQGFRVMALAKKITTNKDNIFNKKDLRQMTFLGLVGFIDPLRAESKEAVKKCRNAGIEVAMITGDHPITAMAIAKQLEIADDNSQIITGSQMNKLGPPDTQEFFEKISACRVFAEVSPIQKYQIVETMSKAGHYVAVTGDGANDAPALKRANLGVAMGSGTDVAKETASMIIINDDFSSIVAGIEEGRFAYDNVRKVIFLLISTGAAEIILFALAIFSGLPLPLFAVQLLWLNLVTNGIQDVALAFEAGEDEAMSRPPRSPKEGIFNALMIQQTLLSGLIMGSVAFLSWMVCVRILHIDESTSRNFVFLLMVLFENLHAFNCRSEHRSIFKISLAKNKILLFGVIGAHAIHIFAMYNPFLSKVLQVAPINFQNWIILLGIALTIVASSEIFKFFKRIGAKKINSAIVSQNSI